MKVKFNQFKTKLTRNSDSKGSNIMKKNRKLTALLVAACMTIPMAATTFTVPMMASGATGGSNSITINDDAYENKEMYAYQVFAGNYSGNILGVSDWGDGINVTSFIAALQSDSIFIVDSANIFAGIAQEKTSTTAQAVAAKISSLTSDAQKEAVARYAVIHNNSVRSGNYDWTNKKITDLPDGYYVVADTSASNSDNNTGSAWTLGLLKVAGGGDVAVTPKRTHPTLEKKIKLGDSDYVDVADFCIGDKITFRLTGELPNDLSDYAAYYYVLYDTFDANDCFTYNYDITVTVAGASVSDGNNCKIRFGDNSEGKSELKISFEDIKQYVGESYNISGTANDIVVEYSVTLNNNATIGNGASGANSNSAKVFYLNNPNTTYTPILNGSSSNIPNEPWNAANTDETPEDIVKVFTYQLDIDKYKEGATATKLQDAQFKLKNSAGKYVTVDANNKVTGWVDTEEAGSTFTTDGNGKASIIGLDSGTYQLIETVAPGGYNKLTAPIDVNIQASLDSSTLRLTQLLPYDPTEDDNETSGIARIGVANNEGAQLPSTGGIGTKIFYVLGGTLVIGSGAALVIKKRMGKDEE